VPVFLLAKIFFFGDINIFRGEVTASNAGVVAYETTDAYHSVPNNPRRQMKTGQKAIFAIRPEKNSRVSRTKTRGWNQLSASGEGLGHRYLGDMTGVPRQPERGCCPKPPCSTRVPHRLKNPSVYGRRDLGLLQYRRGVVLGS